MGKIRITRPQSTGTHLYGSLRSHSSFVALSISLGNSGDHVDHDGEDDTGFKGAHQSTFMRVVRDYDHSKPSISYKDEIDPKTGKWKVGSYVGQSYVAAPEVEEDRGTVMEVLLSFEQFAELLSSTGHEVDCTVETYAPVGHPNTHYSERVTPPPSIYDRAKRRMGNAQEKALEEIDLAMEDLGEMKATKKVKDAMRHRLEMIEQHLIANAGFVVQQATEEMSSIAEAANVLIMDKVGELVARGKLSQDTLRVFHGEPAMLPAPEEEE